MEEHVYVRKNDANNEERMQEINYVRFKRALLNNVLYKSIREQTGDDKEGLPNRHMDCIDYIKQQRKQLALTKKRTSLALKESIKRSSIVKYD